MIRPADDYLPKLADWGQRVTLCIAGLSETRRKLTIVSDMKVNLGHYAADWAALKSDVVCRGYIVQYAGNDAEHVPFILRTARAILAQHKGRISPSTVAEAVDVAYRKRLSKIIETSILARYGYTNDSFQQYGKKRSTASVYNALCNKIAGVNLSLRFLITGFDDEGYGHIMVAGGEEAPTDYTKLGFFAIGSGANAAMSSLLFNKHKRRMLPNISEAVCVYCLCEAKFMAEPTGIGDTTFVVLMQPPGKGGFKFITEIGAVRKLWEKEGQPRFPVSVEEKVAEVLRPAKDIYKSSAAKNKAKKLPKSKSPLNSLELVYERGFRKK